MKKMKLFRRFLTALLIVTLLTAACAPTALASFKAKMFTTTKVYKVPSTSAKSIHVPKGLTVTVTAASSGWARIQYKGRTAYVQIPYLDLASRLTAYTCKSTAVYRQPTTSSSKMGTLSIGTAVYVVNKIGDFYRVQNSSGSVSGYVMASNLTSKAKITAAYNAYKKQQAAKKVSKSKPSGSGNSAVDALYSALKSQIGKPYSASATFSYNPDSFNCSTFVRYILEGCFGIPMKGTAEEQAADDRYAKISSISSLRAGDILCFRGESGSYCDHTGIFVGKKGDSYYFVEASRNARKVQLNELDDYYKEHFLWARRPTK